MSALSGLKLINCYMQIDRYNENNNAYNPTTVEEYLRQQYFECLSLVITSIKECFNQPTFVAFLKMEQLLINIIHKEDFSTEFEYVQNIT